MPILGAVFGEEYPAVLAAAQHGSDAAFTRLWLHPSQPPAARPVHHALIRPARIEAGRRPPGERE
jgi:hypothetical protein